MVSSGYALSFLLLVFTAQATILVKMEVDKEGQVVRQNSSRDMRSSGEHCTEVVSVPETAETDSKYWEWKCLHIPLTAEYVKVTVADITDYFKPIEGATFCEMLTSYEKHMWSNDAIHWFKPEADSWSRQLLGGSKFGWPKNNVPSEGREYITFWGSKYGRKYKGGCCQKPENRVHKKHPYALKHDNWHVPFAMFSCERRVASKKSTKEPDPFTEEERNEEEENEETSKEQKEEEEEDEDELNKERKKHPEEEEEDENPSEEEWNPSEGFSSAVEVDADANVRPRGFVRRQGDGTHASVNKKLVRTSRRARKDEDADDAVDDPDPECSGSRKLVSEQAAATGKKRWCGHLKNTDQATCEGSYTYKKCSKTAGQDTVYYKCKWSDAGQPDKPGKKCYAEGKFTCSAGVGGRADPCAE